MRGHPEPKPRGYISIEEVTAIEQRHDMADTALVCGYNRQPFNLRERDGSVSIDSTCAHFNAQCKRTVKDGARGYATDQCLFYTTMYGPQDKK